MGESWKKEAACLKGTVGKATEETFCFHCANRFALWLKHLQFPTVKQEGFPTWKAAVEPFLITSRKNQLWELCGSAKVCVVQQLLNVNLR